MHTHTHWKAEIDDLRSRAHAVRTAAPTSSLNARDAARCLSGVVNLLEREHGREAMQRACAELVRCEIAWDTSFGKLPHGRDGRVPEAIEMLAVVARGILPIAGPAAMRAALAFWASESDPAVWQQVVTAQAP